jgi:O-methyltransferase domain/Dimerisation domain
MNPRPPTSKGAVRTAQQEFGRLMDSFLTTQLMYVAAKLGVADELAAGPRSAAAVADAVGADPAQLKRILRGLALEGVLSEEPDGSFALTPLGECLRDGVEGSMRAMLIVRAELYYRAAAGLLPSVKNGVTPFEHVYGERFFDYLGTHPEQEAAFHGSMAVRAAQEAAAVVDAYDFDAVDTLVDVGGGTGITLAAILDAAPLMRATLVDLPGVLPRARERLGERAECVAGDFFERVPAGADAYLLSRVLHDWDDADALRILATVRAAMPAWSRLLIVEAILPERAHEQPAAIRMDIHMMVLLGARERTEAEYRELLAAAGFEVARVVPTGSPAGLGVIEARASAPARTRRASRDTPQRASPSPS